VTSTTVNNRIEQLEAEGVILGYNPEIDYERAGYPMRVLFICSTDLSRRSKMAEEILEVRGVVNVREMLAGTENLHVEVVAEPTAESKRSTAQLDDMGLQIVSSNILAKERIQPWNHFHQEIAGEVSESLDEIGGDEEYALTGKNGRTTENHQWLPICPCPRLKFQTRSPLPLDIFNI